MIKPETQINITRALLIFFFGAMVIVYLGDLITPNYIKAGESGNNAILWFFMLLYASYYYTLRKRLFKTHTAIFLFMVVLCIIFSSNLVMAALLLTLLSQSVCGIYRLKRNGRLISDID